MMELIQRFSDWIRFDYSQGQNKPQAESMSHVADRATSLDLAIARQIAIQANA
jgi:hypothetical protein